MIAQHTTHLSAATMGTVPYMPPEMLVSQRMAKATDVYSFGVISASPTPPPPFPSHQLLSHPAAPFPRHQHS